MNRGFVLLLNGCSSSGKTSLARALQRAAPDLQLMHVSLDSFRSMEPEGYWSREQKDQWPTRVAALCHAINATTKQYISHGQNVVLDHVLSKEAWSFLEADLANEPVYLVRVECALSVAEAREAGRRDRTSGLARSQWDSIHLGRDYDLIVDTSTTSPAGLAESVLRWIRNNPQPAALAAKSSNCRAA